MGSPGHQEHMSPTTAAGGAVSFVSFSWCATMLFSSVPNQTLSGKQLVFLAPTAGGGALAFILINMVRNDTIL